MVQKGPAPKVLWGRLRIAYCVCVLCIEGSKRLWAGLRIAYRVCVFRIEAPLVHSTHFGVGCVLRIAY